MSLIAEEEVPLKLAQRSSSLTPENFTEIYKKNPSLLFSLPACCSSDVISGVSPIKLYGPALRMHAKCARAFIGPMLRLKETLLVIDEDDAVVTAEPTYTAVAAVTGIVSFFSYMPPPSWQRPEHHTYPTFLGPCIGGIIAASCPDDAQVYTVTDAFLAKGDGAAPYLYVQMQDAVLLHAEVEITDELQDWREHKDLEKVTSFSLRCLSKKKRFPALYALVQIVADRSDIQVKYSFIRALPIVHQSTLCGVEMQCVYEQVLDFESPMDTLIRPALNLFGFLQAACLHFDDCRRGKVKLPPQPIFTSVRTRPPARLVPSLVHRVAAVDTTQATQSIDSSTVPLPEAVAKALQIVKAKQGLTSTPAIHVHRPDKWTTCVWPQKAEDKVIVVKLSPTLVTVADEYAFYVKLERLDERSVPALVGRSIYNVGDYRAHVLTLKMLFDLHLDVGDCLRQILLCFETAHDFMLRVLYLLGLLTVEGIVHGDLKLSNFALDRSGTLRVLDFSGSACDGRTQRAWVTPKVPRKAILSFTPLYHAPELTREDVPAVSAAVDVYSCGVMFRELALHLNAHVLDQPIWADCSSLAKFGERLAVADGPDWINLVDSLLEEGFAGVKEMIESVQRAAKLPAFPSARRGSS